MGHSVRRARGLLADGADVTTLRLGGDPSAKRRGHDRRDDRLLAAQTHKDWEAIVVDDGSTDATGAIVEEHAARDPRLRLITGESRGVGAARNLGIAEARDPLLFLLDADNLIDPTALERLAAPLEEDDSLIGSTCGWARLSPRRRRGRCHRRATADR